MKTYGQFCPIARASEVIAERWTPIILRNLLLGCTTFNEISAGAPMLSRALLTKRLRELERAGVVEITPKPSGHGSVYQATRSGRELWGILIAMGGWAERWMEVTPEHSDADMVLWSWCHDFLCRDRLPKGRALARFEFENPLRPDRARRRAKVWLLVQDGDAELCTKFPGFEEDAVVIIVDPLAFARWHLGLVDWGHIIGSGGIVISGSPAITRALPTWNSGPETHTARRVLMGRAPSPTASPPGEIGPRKREFRAVGTNRDDSIPGFTGWIVRRGDERYDEARAVWNGAIDRHPALIAGCRTTEDVVAAVRYGREAELPIAVRAGGHDVAGSSLCDDGMVIDLSLMNAIQVDPFSATVRAGPGLRWGEFDAVTQAFGLATTGGTMSETGISGLTIGGGIGWLMRRHGMTVDNVRSAEVVLADGRVVTAAEDEHPDLFWALRGGGAGVGVVTSWSYRLHPVGPAVLSGPVLWALEDGPEVLRFYRDFSARAPREVATIVALRKAPAQPFLPAELHGRHVCIIAMLGIGDPDDAERMLAPMRSFGRPLLDLVALRPYVGLQSMFDASNRPGWHYAWKSAATGPLDDPIIDGLLEATWHIGSPSSYSVIFQLGGAVADVDQDQTAFSNRGAAHLVNVNGVWLPQQPIADRETQWARQAIDAITPFARGGYVNFLDRDDERLARTAFHERAYERLGEIKRRYDPDAALQGKVRWDRTTAAAAAGSPGVPP